MNDIPFNDPKLRLQLAIEGLILLVMVVAINAVFYGESFVDLGFDKLLGSKWAAIGCGALISAVFFVSSAYHQADDIKDRTDGPSLSGFLMTIAVFACTMGNAGVRIETARADLELGDSTAVRREKRELDELRQEMATDPNIVDAREAAKAAGGKSREANGQLRTLTWRINEQIKKKTKRIEELQGSRKEVSFWEAVKHAYGFVLLGFATDVLSVIAGGEWGKKAWRRKRRNVVPVVDRRRKVRPHSIEIEDEDEEKSKSTHKASTQILGLLSQVEIEKLDSAAVEGLDIELGTWHGIEIIDVRRRTSKMGLLWPMILVDKSRKEYIGSEKAMTYAKA